MRFWLCVCALWLMTACFDAPGEDAEVDASQDGVPEETTQDDIQEEDTAEVDPWDGYNVVFVSSQPLVPGSLGGDLAVAHAHCQTLAADADLPNPESYVALLALRDEPLLNLLEGSRGWVRADKQPVVDLPSDLAIGRMMYPVVLTEQGLPLTNPRVVTGTLGDLESGLSCRNWTETSDTEVTAGNAYDGPTFWVYRRYGFEPKEEPVSRCDEPLPVYCFGTGRRKELTPPPAPESAGMAFVTANPVALTEAGIADLDTACANEGGSESFRAMLPPDSQTSALSRFTFTGPWVRPDGVVVAESVADLATESLKAVPNLTRLGSTAELHTHIWSPAVSPEETGGLLCADWTGSNNGRISYLGRAHNFYSLAIPLPCDSAQHLLCFSDGPIE